MNGLMGPLAEQLLQVGTDSLVGCRGPLVQAQEGARRDTYPSEMARDMGGGMRVYVMQPGRRARREDLVRTLDNASADRLATIDEQRAFAEAWRADPSKQ